MSNTQLTIAPLSVKASPRDGKLWFERVKEEYKSLIAAVEENKKLDSHWFQISSDPTGTEWRGTCWCYHKNNKHAFELIINLAVTYPTTPPEICLPQLAGKTEKMYSNAAICIDDHFLPLWQKNAPTLGIAHAMQLGLSPWLAIEIPAMIENGVLK